MPAIPLRPVAAAVAARLAGVTNATGWVGQFGARHGLPGITDTPDAPPVKSEEDPRVRPYFVLYPGIGVPVEEANAADTFDDVDIPIAITAAAGDIDDLLALAGRIEDQLYRWAPTGFDGFVVAPLRHPVGYSPQVLLDTTVTPPRHFTRLEYIATAHT